MNNKKGISLIVLVITILVMIILAGVVVVSLQKNNPIEKAKVAKLSDSVSSVRGAISQYAATAQASDNVEKEMETLVGSTPCTVANYTDYFQLNAAATVKPLLGVETGNLGGEFFVNKKTGDSIFVTNDKAIADALKITTGGVKDGIAYQASPAA